MKHLSLALATLFLVSCASTYFAGLDAAGSYKRNLLVNRAITARQSQIEAKDQLESTLREFLALSDYQGHQLKKARRKINRSYQRSRFRADKVQKHNNDMARVGAEVFQTWDKEIDGVTDLDTADLSRHQRDLTKYRFEQLMAATRRAEHLLDPVLSELHDHVIYFKRNLSEEALATLAGKADQVRNDVSGLIRELEASIAAADVFIREVKPAAN